MNQKPTHYLKHHLSQVDLGAMLGVRKTPEEKHLQEETENETMVSWGLMVNSSLLIIINQSNLFCSCRLQVR